MNELEQAMANAGFCRCPNNPARWYAAHSGRLEPAFPLELRVTDAIWIVTREYGKYSPDIPLMRFFEVDALDAYLRKNGRKAEVGAAFSNAWD